VVLFLPPANGHRIAYLGPIEDAAFVATMRALWWHGYLALLAIPIILLPTALGSFILMGIELGVRQSGFGRCERWRFALAWGLGIVAMFPVAILCACCGFPR
jgi:hypothetical protein